MPNCRYCGQPAGAFRFSHRDCGERYEVATKKIPEFFVKSLEADVEPERFRELTTEIAEKNFIDEKELRRLVIVGLTEMVERALEDGRLSEREGERIGLLRHAFGIESADPDFSVVAHKWKKAEILRELGNGKTPDGIGIKGPFPINLAKNETVIWIFDSVTCYKTRTRTEYVGGSHGMSFRLMKGVSYRIGSYRGRAIRTKELADEGTGSLILTSKNIFFFSPMKTFKIPPHKIVSVEPYSDGIAVLRDAANATPIIFKLDDPWFAANAIARLNQLS